MLGLHLTSARCLIFVVGTLTCVAICGCGARSDQQPTAPVHGKISYKSKPVTTGTITFVPSKSGPTATGEIQKDGTYKLTSYAPDDGAVLGSHTVMIISMQDQANRLPEDRNPLPPPMIPMKYSNNERSGLTATVKAGDNIINFDLMD